MPRRSTVVTDGSLPPLRTPDPPELGNAVIPRNTGLRDLSKPAGDRASRGRSRTVSGRSEQPIRRLPDAPAEHQDIRTEPRLAQLSEPRQGHRAYPGSSFRELAFLTGSRRAWRHVRRTNRKQRRAPSSDHSMVTLFTGPAPAGGVDHHNPLKLFEHPAHDAGAERASSASNHPLRYSRPMLGAEFLGPSQNRTCSRIEPFPESPVISGGVIGTLGESNGKSHWRNSNHASIRPELVRILHVLFPLS
jgi:hypothetical protein